MELTCLNCLGTFEVDEARAPAPGDRIQCPICGTDQAFVGQDEARVKRPATPQPPPRSSRMTTAFRKPMQAFSSGTSRSATPSRSEPAGEAATTFPWPDQRTPPSPVPSFDLGGHTPPEATLPPLKPDAEQEGSGAWVVRSPTGLVLEFPASEYLVNWSAVVDNPGPYQVSRGGQEWTSLAEFLRLVRQGNRSTSAFRTATRAPNPPLPAQEPAPSPASPATPGTTTVPSARTVTAPTHPTSQFQIKLKQPAGASHRRWVFVGLGLVVLAGVAVAAAYFLKLF